MRPRVRIKMIHFLLILNVNFKMNLDIDIGRIRLNCRLVFDQLAFQWNECQPLNWVILPASKRCIGTNSSRLQSLPHSRDKRCVGRREAEDLWWNYCISGRRQNYFRTWTGAQQTTTTTSTTTLLRKSFSSSNFIRKSSLKIITTDLALQRVSLKIWETLRDSLKEKSPKESW